MSKPTMVALQPCASCAKDAAQLVVTDCPITRLCTVPRDVQPRRRRPRLGAGAWALLQEGRRIRVKIITKSRYHPCGVLRQYRFYYLSIAAFRLCKDARPPPTPRALTSVRKPKVLLFVTRLFRG